MPGERISPPDQAKLGPARVLRADERIVIAALLSGRHDLLAKLDMGPCPVQDMSDGGMGSIRFVRLTATPRQFGEEIVEAEFIDADGIAALIAINLDQDGEIFEMDIWKVDFSPLKRFPRVSDLKILR